MTKEKNRKRGVLLASFMTDPTEDQIMEEVQAIADLPHLSSKHIFLFQHTNDSSRWMLTYNLFLEHGQPYKARLYTIRLHRRKDTNTLYTINALNAAVREQHDGQIGKHLKIDWSVYPNSLLLAAGKKLQVHPVEVVKIFKIEEPPEEN